MRTVLVTTPNGIAATVRVVSLGVVLDMVYGCDVSNSFENLAESILDWNVSAPVGMDSIRDMERQDSTDLLAAWVAAMIGDPEEFTEQQAGMARTVVNLCRTFSCLPSDLYGEDPSIVSMTNLVLGEEENELRNQEDRLSDGV